MNNIKKDALIAMIRDYTSEKRYEIHYDYDCYDEYTTFYINGEAHTIVWDHFDNIYKAFNQLVESVEKIQKPEPPRSIYISTARASCTNPFLNSNSTKIKNVIFNDPATIVFWNDGTKTVVKCQDGDYYDAEKGLTMAISKKFFGNTGRYYNEIKKWVEAYELEQMVAYDFKLTLPDWSTINDCLQKLANAIILVKDDDEIKKEEILEKIDRVLTAFDTCSTSYGCVRCPYDTNKGRNCTSDRRVENIELLKEFRDLLTKE